MGKMSEKLMGDFMLTHTVRKHCKFFNQLFHYESYPAEMLLRRTRSDGRGSAQIGDVKYKEIRRYGRRHFGKYAITVTNVANISEGASHLHMAKFHYADFPETSSDGEVSRKSA